LHFFLEHHVLVGGFNPSEKYESQLGLFFPIYGEIKNVPNHQAAFKMSHALPLRRWLW